MSDIDKIRRKVLQLGFGAALSWPVSSAFGATVKITDYSIETESYTFLKEIANSIIPRSDSPSATEVNADVFALNVVIEAKQNKYKERFFTGSMAFQKDFFSIKKSKAKSLEINTLTEYITQLLHGKEISDEKGDGLWFIEQYRKLLITGWVLSEEVAKSEFRYRNVIGPYQPRTDDKKIILTSNLDKLYI